MAIEYPVDTKELKIRNIQKYKGVPPSWDIVQQVIRKSGLKRQSRFEIVWGIPRKLLTQYKNGDKVLPCRYWHIFYDFDKISKKSVEKLEDRKEKSQPVKILSKNKNLLDEFRANLSQR